jgi:hypothetical protein
MNDINKFIDNNLSVKKIYSIQTLIDYSELSILSESINASLEKTHLAKQILTSYNLSLVDPTEYCDIFSSLLNRVENDLRYFRFTENSKEILFFRELFKTIHNVIFGDILYYGVVLEEYDTYCSRENNIDVKYTDFLSVIKKILNNKFVDASKSDCSNYNNGIMSILDTMINFYKHVISQREADIFKEPLEVFINKIDFPYPSGKVLKTHIPHGGNSFVELFRNGKRRSFLLSDDFASDYMQKYLDLCLYGLYMIPSINNLSESNFMENVFSLVISKRIDNSNYKNIKNLRRYIFRIIYEETQRRIYYILQNYDSQSTNLNKLSIKIRDLERFFPGTFKESEFLILESVCREYENYLKKDIYDEADIITRFLCDLEPKYVQLPNYDISLYLNSLVDFSNINDIEVAIGIIDDVKRMSTLSNKWKLFQYGAMFPFKDVLKIKKLLDESYYEGILKNEVLDYFCAKLSLYEEECRKYFEYGYKFNPNKIQLENMINENCI